MTDLRRVAVALAGFAAFVNLYAPQSVLPLLSQEFGVGPLTISTALTASTLAVALTAPFCGAAADVLGRRRVIAVAMFALVVPSAMIGLAPDLPSLIAWRFVQGLVLPPIFVVTVAYIGEEWPVSQVVGITGTYLSATSFGGFFGRFISGCSLTSRTGAARFSRSPRSPPRSPSRWRCCCPRSSGSCAQRGLPPRSSRCLRICATRA